MLILTRKVGESIRINDDIMLTINNIKGKQVSVGIEAPKNVTILRDELIERFDNGATDGKRN